MAAIQKIRSKGKLLLCVIGVAMLAFILETAFQVLGGRGEGPSTTEGSVNGNKLSQKEYNEWVDNYKNYLVINNQISAEQKNDDEISARIKDDVWSQWVSNQLIETECQKLGIEVSDKEFEDAILAGAHPVLAGSGFVNAQGQFDITQMQNFMQQYDEIMSNPQAAMYQEQAEMIYKNWQFVKELLRRQMLAEKYQTLVASMIVSNPISAKAGYEARMAQTDIQMAALPYSTIMDSEVTVSDAELDAKYQEIKKLYKLSEETRDIKYIDVTVTPSPEDTAYNYNAMLEAYNKLAGGANAANIARSMRSRVNYNGVAVSKGSLPYDVQNRLETMAVGEMTSPYYYSGDNTYNIIKLNDVVQAPDSIEYHVIAFAAQDVNSVKATIQRADSALTVIKGGVPFDTIAKQNNQPATKDWMVTAQYENAQLADLDKKIVNTLQSTAKGEVKKIETEMGALLLEVTDRRNTITKYDVVVVKTENQFYPQTSNKTKNALSEFLAKNGNDITKMEQNPEGYIIRNQQYVTSAAHNIGNVAKTRNVITDFVFGSSTKTGSVSPIYTCGPKQDHFVVAVVTKVRGKGYRDMSDEYVASAVRQQAINDKKAEMLQQKMAKANSIEAVAALNGAITDTIPAISLATPASVQKIGASEPALSGAASKAQAGKFVGGIKGNSAVYALQVTNKVPANAEGYNAEAEQMRQQQQNMQVVRSFIGELAEKISVHDYRYKFSN